MSITRKEAEKLAEEMVMEYFSDILVQKNSGAPGSKTLKASIPKVRTVKEQEKVFWEVVYATDATLSQPEKNSDFPPKYPAKITRKVIVNIDKKTGERTICTSG